jgi:hypothetical protein
MFWKFGFGICFGFRYSNFGFLNEILGNFIPKSENRWDATF